MTLVNEIISYAPSTGEEVGRYPDTSPEMIQQLVARAKVGAENWSAIGFKGRKGILRKWAAYIAANIDELANLVSKETGKPTSDAMLEVALAIDHLSWAAKNAERYLKNSYRSPGLLMANMSTHVEHVPLGVVGVIGPWNYPVFTPIGSIGYALAAGNAVVFKPSEYTPGVGHWLGESFNHVAPGINALFVATGGPETGKALAESAVNKIAFTGSTRTGKKVAASCATNLTPVLMECGGKDAAIIDIDADINRAAEAVLWGAMANAGQTCIGMERVYVHAQVADKFISEIGRLAATVVAGKSYGAATMPAQLAIIDAHIKDAASKGATFIIGSADSVVPPYTNPTIMTNVPENSSAMTEETFGPTLAINRVNSMGEAIALTNASRYGLGASVWSKRNGKSIASQLQCGMVSVNSVMSFTASPTMPFGGIKDSGYGRIQGPEGLREFTYCRAVVRTRFNLPLNLTSLNRSTKSDNVIKKLIQLLNR